MSIPTSVLLLIQILIQRLTLCFVTIPLFAICSGRLSLITNHFLIFVNIKNDAIAFPSKGYRSHCNLTIVKYIPVPKVKPFIVGDIKFRVPPERFLRVNVTGVRVTINEVLENVNSFCTGKAKAI